MIKGFIILADGFETVEALATHDILLRTHKIESTLVGLDKLDITSSNNTKVHVDLTLDDINENDFDFVVLPGGKIGVENLEKSQKVKDIVSSFVSKGKLVAAICAAPSILGNLGLLDDKTYTCFPSFQRGKGNYANVGSYVDENIITGHSMYYSIEFAEKIVSYYLGKQGLESIYFGTRGA